MTLSKVVSIVGLLLFVLCGALAQQNIFPHMSPIFALMAGTLGLLGYGVAHPIVGSSGSPNTGATTTVNVVSDVKTAPAKPTIIPPALPPVAVLLLAMALGLSACSSTNPNVRSFAACLESNGINDASGAGAQAISDLSSGADANAIELQLEALAGKGALQVVTCAVQSWLLPEPSSAPRAAPHPSSGVKAAHLFLAAHAGQ